SRDSSLSFHHVAGRVPAFPPRGAAGQDSTAHTIQVGALRRDQPFRLISTSAERLASLPTVRFRGLLLPSDSKCPSPLILSVTSQSRQSTAADILPII